MRINKAPHAILAIFIAALGMTLGSAVAPSASPNDSVLERVVKDVVAPPAAVAGPYCTSGLGCGKFWHEAPDEGYDGGIMVTCNWGDPWGWAIMVYEGNQAGCSDVDGVLARPGYKIVCREAGGGGWYTRVSSPPSDSDGGNWSKITDWERLSCVHQVY